MGRLNLSQEERAAIEKMRAEKAVTRAADDFQRRAIATAHAFLKWSKKTDDGLTFSTFVNTFGYQNDDMRQMYEAVARIFDSARPK